MPLFHLGLEMSERGVLADAALLTFFREKLAQGVEKKRNRFEILTGRKTVKMVKKRGKIDLVEEFSGVSASSPKQLIKWLYTELGLPKQYKVDPKTHGKKLTSDKDAIETLGEKFGSKYPALKLLLWLRRAEKMLSTYAEVITDAIGRIHTTYYTTGTESGRFSSKKTEDEEGLNMQNLPPWFRRVFIADPGKVFVEWDLSQAEARITAYLAGEEEMIAVFNDPKRNIHKLNASKIFHVKEEDVVKDSRPTQPYGKAKRVTHGFDYKLGPRHAAKIAGTKLAEMEKLRIAYFAAFPNLQKWHKFIADISLSSKILVTPYGRRRLFLGRPPRRTPEGAILPNEDLVRKMIAWVPQSTCTEYLKRGMLRIKPELPEGTEILMDHHDGGLAQMWPQNVESFIELVKEKTCIPLPIIDIFGKTRNLIIPAEFKTGNRWGEGMK